MTNRIPKHEMCAAARYFAMSNAAALELAPKYIKDIHQAYNYVDGIMQSETGESLNGEYKSWLDMISEEKSNGYCFNEWNRVKSNWGF